MFYPIKSEKLKVTSGYGNREYKYQGKMVKDFHHGIDLIASPKNNSAEILCIADGTVTGVRKRGKQYGDGCYVRVKHSNGYYSLYFHMKDKSVCVDVGTKVKKGQKIGIIGTTGKSTGVHLHFQIDKGTSATSINPYDYVFGDKTLDGKTPETYTKGMYKCLANMNIRSEANTKSSIKKVKQCTTAMQKALVSKKANDNAVVKKGTIFTALDIVKNGKEYWAKNYSGYICIANEKTKYCSKQ